MIILILFTKSSHTLNKMLPPTPATIKSKSLKAIYFGVLYLESLTFIT